ncbi:MAG: hypothetical protein J5770_00835 [Bacteroidaceae bacterium]|nr:hypothetical protein [Bacteroidaceae bacterium]
MERYELQKLRDLPIEGVAERLGLRVTRHKCLCPFHDDHHASLSFCVRRNTFRCFACGAHGGVIDLVMKYLRKDFLDACRWLDPYGCTHTPSPPRGTPPNLGGELDKANTSASCSPKLGELSAKLTEEYVNPQRTFDARRYERFFERPWLSEAARKFLFEERKLDERVVRWCRLTSWRDRQGIPWLQIPYYDREGRLIGIQNRNLVRGGSPRFRFPSGSECSIYNLPVLNLLKPEETLFITEGCSDCWAMLSAGHKAIAIPSATLLNKKDVELLSTLHAQLSTEFGMYPDNDAPGERLFLQLKEVLPNLEHHQLPPGCKDFSEYYLSTH